MVPPDVDATLLRMLDILENVALTLKAPALLAVNLAAMTPAGALATYSRLNEQAVSIQYLTSLPLKHLRICDSVVCIRHARVALSRIKRADIIRYPTR